MIRSGFVPLWNPDIFSGTPFMASAQVGLLFPLNWFYLVFSPINATNLMVISSYMVAALGAYLFARRSGASVTGAVITSLVWQWGGHLIGQIAHINIVHTAALLPWVLWSVECYAATGTNRRGVLIAALVAIQLFAGHHQTFVYSLMLVTAYGLVMAFSTREKRKRYLASLAYLGSGIILAAVQILPTFELLRNSNRATASYEFLTSFSLPRSFVGLFVAPYVRGGGDGRLFRAPYIGPPFYPELIGYVGILALMLAVLVVVLKRDTRTKFWTAIAFVALLLAFGRHAPLGVYKAIYFVPVLNLFRVPARHLMEVDFALAVLAGRGFTALAETRRNRRVSLRVAIVSGSIFLLALITVTALRPSGFRMGREAPISFLRAPELFLPVLITAVSALALWWFVRQRRGATALIIAVLAVDLIVWGQSSSWYTDSPKRDDEYWRVPQAVHALHRIAPANSSYRILTAPHTFDPAVAPVGPSVSRSTDWVLWTQPDVYMMHGFQNAAGYDGFVLDRYSKLASQMKVWGELTDPDGTLRGESRELDLLNVHFLVSMKPQSTAEKPVTPNTIGPPTVKIGDSMFAPVDFVLPVLTGQSRLRFSVAPVEADRLAIISSLAWAENVPDKAIVGQIRLNAADGRHFDLPLRAGVDTAEWAHDRPDINARVRHRRPTIATSYEVRDAKGRYDAHNFVTSLPLPEKASIVSGEIWLEPIARAPDLSLSVFRVSLVDSTKAASYPLRRDAITVGSSTSVPGVQTSQRWQLAAQTDYVQFFKNRRTLPRAWLASDVRVLDDNATLEVIRSGKFSDGSTWDPARTVLIESDVAEKPPGFSQGVASITKYEPNRIDISTKADTPSLLVLSENHYPGWRVYVDGRLLDTLRVNYNLRGVLVPAGEHRVEFVYWPKSLFIGLFLSLATLLGLLAWRPVVSRLGGLRNGMR